MQDIIRIPDRFKIHYDKAAPVSDDGVIRFLGVNGKLKVFLTATRSKPAFIELRWYNKTRGDVKILGDAWERGYGNLQWTGLCAEKFLPWYFLLKTQDGILACGVETCPSSLVSWSVDKEGISCWLDVRCGGTGVELGGRELEAAAIVSKIYKNISSFEAATRFCKLMAQNPVFPEKPVYGGNNWYYAYGKSSYIDIINDTKLIAELSEGNENRPFMVIDDGWQLHSCTGPWEPNEKFVDMEQLADDIKSLDVRPGIWVRFLSSKSPDIPNAFRLKREGAKEDNILDPSHPKVLQYVARETRKLAGWGYELIKHDYSTFDMFGYWGKQRNGKLTEDGWSFYDKAKTSAEIVKNFYRTIYENADGAMILGCNTIAHLICGYAQLNRTGDDTSGRVWDKTRELGINTLAFRMPHNGTFYTADADCVGIMKGRIKWKYNKQWLDLLSRSSSAVFISCANGTLSKEELAEAKEAFKYASLQQDTAVPLDWEQTTTPQEWSINGEKVEFEWYGNGAPMR